MEIKAKEIGVFFKSLKPGEVFKADGGNFYLKIFEKPTYGKLKANAVYLLNGTLRFFAENEAVRKVKGSFVEE